MTVDPPLLICIQLLDGISGSVLGVLTALIVADLTKRNRQIQFGPRLCRNVCGHWGDAQYHVLWLDSWKLRERNWISQHCRRGIDYSISRLVIDARDETFERKK